MSQQNIRKTARTLGCLSAMAASMLGLFSVGCSVEVADSRGGESKMGETPTELSSLELARVTLAGGNVVSWYELEPGVIATRESSTYPNGPMLRDVDMNGTAFTAVELFTSLSPEEPVPDELMAAYDRSQTLAFADDTSPIQIDQVAADAATPNAAADGVARVQQALVDDSACPWIWFAPRCNLCATGPCGSWQVSWPQITGDSSFSRKGTLTRAAMCVYRGAVRHVFRLRGKDIHDTIQRDGQWVTFYLNNGSHKFTLGSRVEQAAGDGYHHCGQGH